MSNSESTLQLQHWSNVECVRHLHLEAECILVTQGTVHVLQSGADTVLTAGEALFLKPLSIHGFHTPSNSYCTILIFPTDLVPDFTAARFSPSPFQPSEALVKQLQNADVKASEDLLHLRALLYPLCCEIADKTPSSAGNYTEDGTLNRVEQYIWENLSTPLSLKAVAIATGYNPSYLSRMFRQTKGVGYLEFVNMLRCGRAVRLLSSSDSMSVSEIAYQVGFESIRTFNRVFLQRYGITPTQMKQQKNASLPMT